MKFISYLFLATILFTTTSCNKDDDHVIDDTRTIEASEGEYIVCGSGNLTLTGHDNDVYAHSGAVVTVTGNNTNVYIQDNGTVRVYGNNLDVWAGTNCTVEVIGNNNDVSVRDGGSVHLEGDALDFSVGNNCSLTVRNGTSVDGTYGSGCTVDQFNLTDATIVETALVTPFSFPTFPAGC